MSKWTLLLTPITATAAYLFQAPYNMGGDTKRRSWCYFFSIHIKQILEESKGGA